MFATGAFLLTVSCLPALAQNNLGQDDQATTGTIITRDVEVLENDSFQSIAERELGRRGFAPKLAEFNRLIVDTPLMPGDVIRVPVFTASRGEFAEVIFIKGDVSARRPSVSTINVSQSASADSQSYVPVAIQRNSELVVGDLITTGSSGYVSIEFSSGAVINLQPSTEAVLTRLNCLAGDKSCIIEIEMLDGNITSDVNSRDKQPTDFRIVTPYASAAVRGTIFDTNASSTRLVVGVTEGAVDVAAQQQTQSIAEGFGSVVQAGEPPSRPISLLPAPVVKRVPARVAEGDILDWFALSSASTYTARLTTDSSAIETLNEFQVDTNQLAFPAIEPGNYFLNLRAEDSNGLQGFSTQTRLTIAEIDNSLPIVETTASREGNEIIVSVQDPPEIAFGFEIQVADNAEFNDPISVDVNQNGSAVFRLDNDRVYTRARVIVDTLTVSAFGPANLSD